MQMLDKITAHNLNGNNKLDANYDCINDKQKDKAATYTCRRCCRLLAELRTKVGRSQRLSSSVTARSSLSSSSSSSTTSIAGAGTKLGTNALDIKDKRNNAKLNGGSNVLSLPIVAWRQTTKRYTIARRGDIDASFIERKQPRVGRLACDAKTMHLIVKILTSVAIMELACVNLIPAFTIVNASTIQTQQSSIPSLGANGQFAKTQLARRAIHSKLDKFKYTLDSLIVDPNLSSNNDNKQIKTQFDTNKNGNSHQNSNTYENSNNFRNYLLEFRRKLYSPQYNGVSESRQVSLGSPCLSAKECSDNILNSHCELNTFTCSCLPYHVKLNNTTCLPPSLLGYTCQIDAQCQMKVKMSTCVDNKCKCDQNYVQHRKDKCLAASNVNDFCLNDNQCSANDKHSFCQWKIPQVYGFCKCPPNYQLLATSNVSLAVNKNKNNNNTSSFEDTRNWIGANSSSASQPIGIGTAKIKCVPRLGDSCISSDECQLATENSICLPMQKSDLTHKSPWKTSLASSSRCQCANGFVVSQNKLTCNRVLFADGTKQAASMPLPVQVPAPRPLPVSFMTPTNQLKTEGRRSSSPQTTTSIPSPLTTMTLIYPQLTSVDIIETTKTKPQLSSLGKPCKSSADCKLRDEFSFCLNGYCECEEPSDGCSSTSTGCHADTFQCRNGQCISWYFVCDDYNNCDDGSDEDECSGNSTWNATNNNNNSTFLSLPGKQTHTTTTTTTTTTTSTANSALNNSSTFTSGELWTFKSKARGCPSAAFQCSNGACIARGKICDGKRDCADNSDEEHCQMSLGTSLSSLATGATDQGSLSASSSLNNNQKQQDSCPQATFACNDGQCLPAYVFCNAVVDCKDGSDELEHICEPKRRSFTKLDPQFQSLSEQRRQLQVKNNNSTSNNVILTGKKRRRRPPRHNSRQLKVFKRQVNNNFWRRSIENHQFESKELPQTRCPSFAFQCANGKCRSSAVVCSGVDACGDQSDENKCEVCMCKKPRN